VADQPALDPATGAARRHPPGQPEAPRVAEQGLHSREEGLGVGGAGRGLPDLALQLLAGQRLSDERLEVGVGVEAPVGAEGVLPLVEAQELAAALVGAAPGLEDRGLGVDDEAVEVEDDGFDDQSCLVRKSIVRSQLLTAASRS
jgi:hypothetical protein